MPLDVQALLNVSAPKDSQFYIVIPCDPIAWKRAGVNFKAKSFYDKQCKEKVMVSSLVKQVIKAPIDGPVAVTFKFNMPIPKSYPDKLRKGMVEQWHIKKPDLDNLEKFLLDAMNETAYHDDCQVCMVLKEKVYSLEPRIEIFINALALTH